MMKKRLFLKTLVAMAVMLSACTPTPAPVTPRVITIQPAGTILFSGASLQSDGQFSLFTMNGDGSNRVQLVSLKGDALGAKWSPDGKQIAASIEQDGRAQLFLMNADGKGQRQLTRAKNAINAEWSPDGKQLAFVSNDLGQYDIYTINSDGTGLRRITQSKGDHLQPAWSPDGSKIAYVASIAKNAEYSGTYQLFITTLSGAEEQITKAPSASYQYPSWSRDGKQLVFASDPTGVYEIYKLDMATKQVTPLTAEGEPSTQPRFSPDDKLIVYTVFTSDGWRLHLMTADGKAHTPIDQKNMNEFFPDWKK